MYEYFQGKLVKITPTYIVVDVASIGYLINVANPYAWSHMMNQEIKIYVHQVIREDVFLDGVGTFFLSLRH
jgi:holliday junction DNA helicase RuvA